MSENKERVEQRATECKLWRWMMGMSNSLGGTIVWVSSDDDGPQLVR